MGRSAKERLWLTGGTLVAVLLLVIGYFLLISPQRNQTSSVNSSIDTVRAQNFTLQQRINNLTAQNKELAKYQADLADLKLALPSTSGLPDFLRTLQSIGNGTLSDVVSLTVGPPTDLNRVAGGSRAKAAGNGGSATSGGGAGTGGSTNGVYGLTITAQVSGSTSQLEQFLQQLQAVQPRAVLISAISFGTGAGAAAVTGATGKATMQITMQAFVAPVSAAEAAQLAKAAHG